MTDDPIASLVHNSSEWSFARLFDWLVDRPSVLVAADLVKLLTAGNVRTRWRAAIWLARTGNPACADTLAALLDAHAGVPVSEAALVLKNLGRMPATSNEDPDSLVQAMLEDGGSIRVAAAWALGLVGDARALPVLLPLVAQSRDGGSIVPILERILSRNAAPAADADLRAAASLIAPPQLRGYGDNSQFGSGPGVIDLTPLNLDFVRQRARKELTRRGLS